MLLAGGLDLQNQWGFYLSLGILALLLIAVISIFAVTQKRDENYKRVLDEQSNSVRVFVIDMKKDQVRYFNVTSLQDVHICTVAEFYQKFPIEEQKKVINWISAVADRTTQAPDYLETGIQENRTHRQYFSMLQKEAVDYDRQIIHLQSYVLKYIGTSRGDGTFSSHGLSTMKQVEEAITANGTRHGATFAFHFAYKTIHDQDKEIEPLVFNQFKNALFPFLQGKRYLMQASGNELILCDLRVDEKAKGLYLMRSCLSAINRYLSLNGYLSSIEAKVGVVEHRFFQKEPEKIIDSARRLASEAFNTKETSIWYERGRKPIAGSDDGSYRTEVERVINGKKLRYKFRPVFSVSEGKVIGYLTKADPIDTFFDSMDDLKEYAIRTQDDGNLFSVVARDTIRRFLAERPDESQILFFPLRIVERGHMLNTFSRLPSVRSAHPVMVFSESDISSHLDSTDEDGIIGDMRTLNAKGYQVALCIDSAQMQLSSSVCGAFDYFICSFASESASANGPSTMLRSHLHSMVEKLLKYQKPIIASDFEGWPALELMVRSGMNYISSEAFAPYDTMMNPVNPKTVKRVKDMKN